MNVIYRKSTWEGVPPGYTGLVCLPLGKLRYKEGLTHSTTHAACEWVDGSVEYILIGKRLKSKSSIILVFNI